MSLAARGSTRPADLSTLLLSFFREPLAVAILSDLAHHRTMANGMPPTASDSPGGAIVLQLTPRQILTITRIVNVFETGSPEGDYSNISIFPDGPGDRRQITYGRSQTTEFGHLKELIQRYYDSKDEDTTISEHLVKFLPKIGIVSLANNTEFIHYLRLAGKTDPAMKRTQDQFFYDIYFRPAIDWCDSHGLFYALSALVVYDSYIHSGGMLPVIRRSFPAVPPVDGGDEKEFISQYVNARDHWLSHHRRKILHSTVYRTRCFLQLIRAGNWSLDELPILANGVKVY